MPTQTEVTEYKTLEEFPARTSFADNSLVKLYVQDDNEAATVDKPANLTLAALLAMATGSGFINTDGTIFKISAAGTVSTFAPASDTDAARGTALATALASYTTGDRFFLGPKTYTTSAEVNVSVGANERLEIYGQGTIIKRADATPTDWVLQVTVAARGYAKIYGIEVDGNQANVTLTSERGEGFRLTANGQIDCVDCYSHDAPSGDAAMNFMMTGTGYIRLIRTRADNPAYANYRIQVKYLYAEGCDSFVSNYRAGQKARFWVMDVAPVREIYIVGGRWWTDQAYKINANFDPMDDFVTYCEHIILRDVQMDFGTGHIYPNTSDDLDSYIKFDNCRTVILDNVTMRHSVPGTPSSSRETLFTIGNAVDRVYMRNVHSDAGIKFASGTSVIYTQLLEMTNCRWGVNGDTEWGIGNCSQCALIIADRCEFLNVRSGLGVKRVFDNPNSTNGQRIKLRNCKVTTNYSSTGYLFNLVDEVGSVQLSNVEVVDNGAGSTVLAPSSAQRLMACVEFDDDRTVYYGRNPLDPTDTYAPGVDIPSFSAPATPDGTWFSGITAPVTSRIVNCNPFYGGNGGPREWVRNSSGNWIADDSITDLNKEKAAVWLNARRSGESTLNNGIIGSWVLREQGTGSRLDYSRGDNDSPYDLTNNNGAGPTLGQVGTTFDGVDQFLSIDDTGAPDIYQLTSDHITVAFTCRFLSKTGDDNAHQPAVTLWNANSGDKGYRIGRLSTNSTPSEEWSFAVNDGSADAIITAGTCAIGTLYHVVCRYDGSNLKMQVNGVDATPVAHTTGIVRPTAEDFRVASMIPPTGPQRYSNCRIDNLTVWNRALSDAEVTEWYNGGDPLTIPFVA